MAQATRPSTLGFHLANSDHHWLLASTILGLWDISTPTAPQHTPTAMILPLLLSVQVKMAVSRKLCGAVIGQKGQTIRDFMQDSGATIRVQPLSELTPSDSERLITVSGGRDKVLRAVALILNTVSAATIDTVCI